MVLRILNLEEQQKCMIGSKVTTMLPTFFQNIKKKTLDFVNPLAAVWTYHCQTNLRETWNMFRLLSSDSLKATLGFFKRLLVFLKSKTALRG